MINLIQKSNIISPALQKLLWSQPHASSSDNIPARLDLCIGMPVMLRHNDATECCITKGAEGVVASWQSSIGPEKQNILDTLFVKLINSPKMIKIDGLPENIVPITRQSTSTIIREQVLVLPNFAMTDYACQGRTHPNNVVLLNSCRNHQSYYTCLSRSSTAAGTIIIEGFDSKVITGGLLGFLRQEFRELELLDEITKLKYERLLPKKIEGHQRNSLITQFRNWKGKSYIPKSMHNAIVWNENQDPFDEIKYECSPWQIINKDKKSTTTNINQITFIPAKGSIPIHLNNIEFTINDIKINKKHKYHFNHNDEKNDDSPKFKKRHVTKHLQEHLQGLIWDAEDWSCAYDSLFTIIHAICVTSMLNPTLIRTIRRLGSYSFHPISFPIVRILVLSFVSILLCPFFPFPTLGLLLD